MSENNTGKKWNREETILAFDLYCRTPFGKIGQSNPDIIELANLLGRTPGSVGLKMHNLAHHDPELQSRNVSAMAHGSKLDLEVFEEFSEDWLELSYQAQLIRARMQERSIGENIDLRDIEILPAGEEREQMMKARVGQYFFRTTVLSSYHNSCCITGLARKELLVASHIKPWKDSDAHTERTNPQNGLCLNAFHDKAFDRGMMTVSTDYRIIISDKLKNTSMDEDTKGWLLKYEGKSIVLPEKFLPDKRFLEFHNDVIFQR